MAIRDHRGGDPGRCGQRGRTVDREVDVRQQLRRLKRGENDSIGTVTVNKPFTAVQGLAAVQE
jgi:hypothetical protein